MKADRRIWISSPRRSAPAILEKTFVGDRKLVDRLVDHVVQSVETPNKHYNLIVGPGGIGKSHLLAVVHHRLQALAKSHSMDFAVAWLPDDPGGLASELHLFEAILIALDAAPMDGEPADGELNRVGDRDSAAIRARERVVETLNGRTLLLCVEGLDQVLSAIGESGQRGLRGFLQQERCCTVLATARALTPDLTDQDRAFFGFFAVHRLRPLDAAATGRLLLASARVRGDSELAGELKGAARRPWLLALHHMLGGLPSRYVDLVRGVEDVSGPEGLLLRALDSHELRLRIRRSELSTQQQLLFQWVANQPAAVQVKQVARACFVSEQTVSPQLRAMKTAGLLRATRVGRETWYECEDPLDGIDVDFALELFAFLRSWFADSARALRGGSPFAAQLRPALEGADGDPRVQLSLPALLRALCAGDAATSAPSS